MCNLQIALTKKMTRIVGRTFVCAIYKIANMNYLVNTFTISVFTVHHNSTVRKIWLLRNPALTQSRQQEL